MYQAWKLIERFSGVRVLIVGDVMLDAYKTPGEVVDYRPGGAANVAANVTGLGGRACLVGVVGDDSAGQMLDHILNSVQVSPTTLVLDEFRPTTLKTRRGKPGNWRARTMQSVEPISRSIADKIFSVVSQAMQWASIVVLSNYNKGVLTDSLCQSIIQLSRSNNRPVIVDPRSTSIEQYLGASILKPNLTELYALAGCSLNHEDFAKVITECVNGLWIKDREISYAVTLGEHGIAACKNYCINEILPVPVDVADTIGAGDTVLAALALTIGSGFPFVDACEVANLCGAASVTLPKTAAIGPNDLTRVAKNRNHG